MDVEEKTAAEEMVEAVEERKPKWYVTSTQGKQTGRLESSNASYSVQDMLADLLGVSPRLIRIRNVYFVHREGGYGTTYSVVYSITGSTNELTMDLDVSRW